MMKIKVMTSIAGLALLSAVIAPVAIAQTTTTPQMAVTINKNGKVTLTGTIASISGNTLSVASWGGQWSVDATSAKIVRRYGGTSSLSEFQNGDQVAVQGTAAQSGWTITATNIRNNSIQTRNASFSGTISNFNASNQTFTLGTTARGNVTISVSGSTTILLGGKQAAFSSLANSPRATVSGIWGRNQSTVIASKISARLATSTN